MTRPLACLAALLWPAAALAQLEPVVVVAPAGEAALPARIRAELGALGFGPTLVSGQGPELDDEALRDLARGLGARAGVTVWASPARAQVWVVRGDEGPVSRWTLTADAAADAEPMLAVRAAEWLRASLLEVAGPEPAPPEGAPDGETGGEAEPRAEVDEPGAGGGLADQVLPPPTPLRDSPPPRGSTLELGVGLGAQWAPGGLPATGTVSLGLAWTPHRFLGAHLLALAPFLPATLSGPEGEADLWIALVGGGARVRVTSPRGPVGFVVDLGGALVLVDARGQARAPYAGRTELVALGAVYVRPLVSYSPARWVRLRLGLTVGLAMPEPVFTFAGRDVAAWGRPMIAADLGADFVAL